MTAQDHEDLVILLETGLTPAQRAELPVTVAVFLMPYLMAHRRIQDEG